MLGHSSAAMTLDRYADLFDNELHAVAGRLDKEFLQARADLLRTLRSSGVVALTVVGAKQAPDLRLSFVRPAGIEPATNCLEDSCSVR